MSGDTDMDNSLSVRRSLRNAVNQSLMSQDGTTNRKRDSMEGDDDTELTDGLKCAKRIKIEQADDEYSDEEEDIVAAVSKRGRSKPKQRYTATKHPLQKKQRRHSSGEFPRRRVKEDFPVRRSTREKRLIFATLNTADMLKQIEGQQAFPLYETEDWMDPYEKLLSPRRDLRRSSRHNHGDNDKGGEASEGGGGASGGKSSGSECKKGEEDENKEHKGTDTRSGDDDGESGKEEEGEEESDEQSEGEGEVGYYLRKRRPVIYQYQPVLQVVEDDDTPPKTRRRQRGRGNQTSYKRPSTAYSPRKPRVGGARKRQAQHHGSSSTSSSGSDADEAKFRRRKKRSMAKARSLCLPMNFDPEDVSTGSVIRDRSRIGASLADVDPMSIDREVTFDLVGGHKHHIRALKEMIVFPLLYPEVFERFKISPPRGVLFFGPPGCGKTLMARALANECSKGGKKVAFFMRKGADCLSKWVGESERQLRLLFDQAYQMRPSIIFFDEIDGLAPVRSSRQDQIHSSIVSTLLALMDGLDNRGEIVVIGATNRIDAIDPALRRPGRFDREFVFPLPSREDRLNILSIHTRLWKPQLKPAFLSELADNTVGYCGADLRALCTEATLFALRRKYPQIYNTTQKLVLDVSSINMQASDFCKGLKSIVPTAQRSDASSGRALAEIMRPLYLETLSSALCQVGFIFPPAWKLVNKAGKEVQGLLEIEAKRSQELKTNIEMLQTSASSFECSESTGKRNSVLVGTKQLGVELQRVNHIGVNNISGLAGKKGSSACKTGLSSQQKEVSRSNLFKIDNLEDIYFELSEVAEDETQRDSILVPEQDSTVNESDERAIATSTRYLSISSHPHTTPSVYRPRLIVCGRGGMGQSSHLAPAILHALEDFQVQTLDLPALFAVSTKTPEEACTQIFREAKRLAPSVVYVPQISSWWEIVPGTFHATFLSILCSLPPDTPLLVLATTECPWTDLPPLLKDLFREVNSEVFTLASPSKEQRRRFFSRVLLEKPLLPPPPPPPRAPTAEVLEELPVAPSPQSRKLTDEELTKIEKQREAVLRELRIFLRDTTNKLLAERKFKEFVKPVNPEEVPDYHEIVFVPMDLSTIMRKIDEHRYTTPKQWMIDVNHITMNALEYNPEHDSESRLLRHRALALQDTANSILDHELSEDFEKQCEEIAETYKRLGKDPSESSPLKYAQRRRATSQSDDLHTDLYNAPRRSLRQKGLQAEEGGFPYYSPSKSRLLKYERGASHDHTMDYEQGSGEEETQDELTSQSEPTKMCASKRHPLHNSNVRRQIIRPWEDHSPSPSLPNGTTESTDSLTIVESSSVTTAAEALVEMGTGTPPKLNSLQGVDSTRHHARLPSTEAVDVIIERGRLLALFERVMLATEETSCEQMERMHATFEHIVFRHRMTTNRSELLEDLELAVHQTLSSLL